MDQSIPNFAKETFRNLKNSFFQGGSRRYYAQMDEESENEEDISHSLFYSVHQKHNINEDSIPLTLSNAYSDRSQLLFEQNNPYEENFKPSAIYLDPTNDTDFGYNNPLSESLLPTSASSRSIEDYVKGSTFKTIRDSAGILSIIIATALIMGTLWMYILRTFTKSLQTNFVYDGDERSAKDTGLTVLSFIPFVTNLVFIKVIYDSRHRITKTVTVIELACDVIRHNPGIILVSMLLLTVFIVFSIVWIIFFNRLWLIGHLGDSSSLSGAIWIVNNYVYSLAAFYVFIYMWTAKLLIYMERFALSSITAQWYFHRNKPIPSVVPWKNALMRASTNSLGTIAFGSLILAVIQFLQFSARFLRKYTRVPRPFATLITIILGYIDMLISTFNNYTISLAGITGESFFSAAKSATKIFRRNLLSGLFGDLLTQLILYIGASVIALSSGFGAYIYATHNLHSPHGFVVGLIATLMPWYLSQFFSYTMMSM
ncbi:plasma-membrane choline transporter-domain-containing protein [Pilaira anomala]|nr:plasma-membrane choline transporter-domain-containing protein [Pilaira anomala]